jgi:methyl coenzyme M reductase gamma subunit
LTENLRDVDDEVIVDIFGETSAQTFTRETVKVPIFEYSIICEVNVQELPAPKKGAKGAQP